MLKIYLFSILMCWVSFVLYVSALYIDVKKAGLKSKGNTSTGTLIAQLIKVAILFAIPVINVLNAVGMWFQYDKVLSDLIQKEY